MGRKTTILQLLAVVVVVFAGVSLFATSAFTTTELTRQVNVSVTTDDSGLLALRDGHPDAGLVEQTGDGQLTVDFTRGTAAGATRNATFVLGTTEQARVVDDHAFRVRNQGGLARDVRFAYTLDGTDQAGGSESIAFHLWLDRGSDGVLDGQTVISENTGENSATLASVAPADTVYVVVVVDTSGLGAAADLSGTLDVTAGETP